MNVRNFSVLYDLLCDCSGENRKTLVRTSALKNRQLPVISQECITGGGLSIVLYFPITEDACFAALGREGTARVNLSNLYSGRNYALSGGVWSVEDQCFLYLLYDAAKPPELLSTLYPQLYQYMDRLADWLGVPLAQT